MEILEDKKKEVSETVKKVIASYTPEAPSTSKRIFSWKTTLRPFHKINKIALAPPLGLTVLICLTAFLFKEYLLIGVVISLFFLFCVLSLIPPEETECKLSAFGLYFAGRNYEWKELGQFWFANRYDQRILNIATRLSWPKRLTLVINKKDEARLENILEEYLFHQEIPPTFFEKITKRLVG